MTRRERKEEEVEKEEEEETQFLFSMRKENAVPNFPRPPNSLSSRFQ